MDFLKDQSILITGGTGSFGQAFVSTLLQSKFKPRKICVYSRDELKQSQMQILFPENEFPHLRFFLGDIRDKERLSFALKDVDIVVHAAALKQVPAAEYNPFEFIKTNTLGSQNLIDACIQNKITRVVALSTDKAAAPINLYGATKLCSDKLFLASNNIIGNTDISFSVVRYGNVLGSRGSVIPHFLRIASENGEYFPITHKDMTRFNITLDEGVQTVIWALEHGVGGEIIIPKIPSYRITDVALAIDPKMPIKEIGIRPGEKLHEEMITFSDAPFTVESADKYLILHPEIMSTYPKELYSNYLPEGFSYNSLENTQFLDVNDIRNLIKENL